MQIQYSHAIVPHMATPDASECDYSRSISLAIQRSEEPANSLRRIVEESRKEGNADAVSVFSKTKLIYQDAIVDLVRFRTQHQASCSECLK